MIEKGDHYMNIKDLKVWMKSKNLQEYKWLKDFSTKKAQNFKKYFSQKKWSKRIAIDLFLLMVTLNGVENVQASPPRKEYKAIQNVQAFKEIASIQKAGIEDVLEAIENSNFPYEYKQIMKEYFISYHEKYPDFDLSLLVYNIQNFKELYIIDEKEMAEKAGSLAEAFFNPLKHAIYLKKGGSAESSFKHEITHMLNVAIFEDDQYMYHYKPSFYGGKYLLEGWTSNVSESYGYTIGSTYANVLESMLVNWEDFVNGGNYEVLVEGLSRIKGTKEDAKAYLSLIDESQDFLYESYVHIDMQQNLPIEVTNVVGASKIDITSNASFKSIEGAGTLFDWMSEKKNIKLIDQTLEYYFASVHKRCLEEDFKKVYMEFVYTIMQYCNRFREFCSLDSNYDHMIEAVQKKMTPFEEELMEIYKKRYNQSATTIEVEQYDLCFLYPFEDVSFYYWNSLDYNNVFGEVEINFHNVHERKETKMGYDGRETYISYVDPFSEVISTEDLVPSKNGEYMTLPSKWYLHNVARPRMTGKIK